MYIRLGLVVPQLHQAVEELAALAELQDQLGAALLAVHVDESNDPRVLPQGSQHTDLVARVVRALVRLQEDLPTASSFSTS